MIGFTKIIIKISKSLPILQTKIIVFQIEYGEIP
jgi:hypothetical protein